MASNAYFMINVAEDAYKNDMANIFKDLETIAEIKEAERVNGFCELLAKVQASNITPVVDRLLAKEWVKRLNVLFVEPSELSKSQMLSTAKQPRIKKPLTDRYGFDN